MPASPRLAVRALILRDARLLLVNAYPGAQSDLWCAPGGGVERGQSLPDALAREVHEELGLSIRIGSPCLVNEFHDPKSGFHQVEIFFRARILAGEPSCDWRDPAGVVVRHRWVSEAECRALRFKPDSLPDAAFGGDGRVLYDPLETIVG